MCRNSSSPLLSSDTQKRAGCEPEHAPDLQCCSQPDTTPAGAGATPALPGAAAEGLKPAGIRVARLGPFPVCRHVKSQRPLRSFHTLPAASCSSACLRAQPLPRLAHLHLRMLFLNSCNACPFLHTEILSKPCCFFFLCFFFLLSLFSHSLSNAHTKSSGISCSPATCAQSTATPRALPNTPRCREQFL